MNIPTATRWMLDAERWLASDLSLELGNRPRWFLVEENHGGTPTLRASTIANRFPPEKPAGRPIETPTQLRMDLVA